MLYEPEISCRNWISPELYLEDAKQVKPGLNDAKKVKLDLEDVEELGQVLGAAVGAGEAPEPLGEVVGEPGGLSWAQTL